ncbi:MAG: ABC transporter permease [Methanomicrobiales archaeon]|nr:ABC transporter permease [Methanomicrobiales archaeon]MDI6876713.1 ABC transporter permease [Methanomicrobiales archaeon]
MEMRFLTIYWRDMLRYFRFKALIVTSLVQPALWMAFFGIAMSSNFSRFTADVPLPPGAHSVTYLTYMGAGMIAMTTLFTSLYGGIILLFDKNWGLMREILASPLPRNDIIIGIGLSGMTKSFIQVFVLTVFGLLLGVEFFSGYSPGDTLISLVGILVFVGLFSLGFLFLSSAIAVTMETPEGLQGVITLLSLPIFFASNALYPIESFPAFLEVVSLFNPLTYLINGIRYFAIGSDFYALGIHYAFTLTDVLVSFLAVLAFAAIMFLLAWWRMRKAVAV